jgi:hypothetical protein
VSTLNIDANVQWIEHKYLYTYRIANRVQAVACNPFAYLRKLESLTLDFGISEYIPHWQKDTALHKFTRYIADEMLEADNCGDQKVPFGDDMIHPRWTIPVEAAFVDYGIREEIEFEIPKVPQIESRHGDMTYLSDAPEVLDACYEHFQWLQLSQAYDDLLHKLADEVFFVMFTNRVTLQCLHKYLAKHTGEVDQEWISEAHPELVKYYTKLGRLRRTSIPKWAQRAIFYRDRGRCTRCKKNISGLLDSLTIENYDHIIPLAKGGLNCVTNLQLLCEACNRSKSDRPLPVSESYRRWF